MQTLDLKPLHNLYQTLEPSDSGHSPHPLIVLAQLQRSGRLNTSAGEGDVEWVVALGGKGKDVDGASKGKSKAGGADEWWQARLTPLDVERFSQLDQALSPQIKKSAIRRDDLVPKIKAGWLEGDMHVKGYGEAGGHPRGSVELVIRLAVAVSLSISLSPCDEAPLSLVSVLAHIIPPYLTASSDRLALTTLKPQLKTATTERDEMRRDRELLRDEVKALKKELSAGGGGRKRAREGSEGVGGSQRPGSVSPKKPVIPGVTKKGHLKPGDKGYAGDSRRLGRDTTDDWDEDTDSD
ncbi:hypothetical protein JCM1840_003073 [Sporobolomyces johnsonii]